MIRATIQRKEPSAQPIPETAAIHEKPLRKSISAIEALHQRLNKTFWKGFESGKPWSLALCAMILAEKPDGRFYQVADAMPYGPHGVDREYVVETMINLGYNCDSISADPVSFDERLRPALFIPANDKDHPYILLRDGQMFDSMTGNIGRTLSGTGPGEVLLFKPYADERDPTSKFSRSNSGMSWFRSLFMRFRPVLIRIFGVGLILNLLALATPLFIMTVYDRVISTNSPSILPMLATGAACAVFLEWGLRVLRSRHLSWMASRLDHIVSNRIFSQLVHMPPSMLEGAPAQAQIARLKTYEAVRDFFSSPVFLSMIELPFTVLALTMVGIIAGPLMLVPLAGIVAYGLLFWMIWRRVRVAIRVAAKAGSAKQRYVLDTLSKLEDIRAAGLPDIWQRKYREISGREAEAHLQLNWLGLVGETLANSVTVLSAVAIVGFGAGMVWSDSISTGAMVASMILVWRILSPFYSLCTMVPRLDQLRNAIRQINQLMDLDTEEQASRALAKPNQLEGRITFAHVGMRYSVGDPVFTGLSFQAQPGQIVAITGENGAGKSTLLKLAKGLYQAPAGNIRLDGFDVRQLDPLSLRRRIAYVPQNPSFFAGTIEENLRFANPVATREDMKTALAQADALDDINALPNGLDTVIGGDGGIQLSSSLALRLSLVRAYLHDAPVLLVDELPNSLLSDTAGRFLKDILIHGRKDRTTLVVTHQVDMLREADQIVWLRLGEPPLAGERDFMLRHLRQGNW